ncbi:MAG: acyltransferase family protein [Chloroflexota bacterium]
MLVDRAASGRNNFQLIRLVLAVAVLYFHSFDLLAADHTDPVLDLIPPATHLGRIALCFFMVISGFLVTHSWLHSAGWQDFLTRRVLRVHPAFIVASAISAFVVAPYGSRAAVEYLESLDLFGFAWNALLLGKLEIPPSFLSNPYPGQVNGSLWSIRIEFECYLGLMVLGLLGILRRRFEAMAIFVLLLVLHAVQGYVPSSLDRFAHHLQLATFFMGGAVFYLYADRIPRTYGWLEVAGLVVLATSILEIGYIELLPIVGTYLLLYLAYEPRLIHLDLGRYGLAWMRPSLRVDLSYGIYLYAWPVQQLIVQAAGPWLNPWTLSLAALAGSGSLAWLSWTLIERPALMYKRRISRPAGAPADASASPTAIPATPAPPAERPPEAPPGPPATR